MGRLFVIRHGQASFFSRDYDNLSDLGHEQGRRLARHWLRWQIKPDRILVGPRKRHQQTYGAIAGEFAAAGQALPESEPWPEFDEYTADPVIRAGIAAVVPTNPSLQATFSAMQNAGPRREREFQRIFEHITRMWVRGDLAPPDAEPFAAFRERIGAGLNKLLDQGRGGETIAVFTSGGPVAASVGHLLDLDHEKTLELSWMVRNAAYNEILFSGGRRSLLSFANTSHLDEPHLLTFR